MNDRRLATVGSLAFLVGAGLLLLSSAASAAAPDIEIVGPMPNAILYENSSVTFEVVIHSATTGPLFRIEWEPNWDGFTTTFTAASTSECTINSFPYAANRDAAAAACLRYNHLLSNNPADEGPKWSRARVTDCGGDVNCDGTADNEVVVESRRYYLIDNVIFSGYTWSGASTADGGSDALGWASFSCANQNLVCQSPGGQGYGVTIGTAPSGTQIATLTNNAWIGDPSGNFCVGGTNPGTPCTTDAQCTGGTCSGSYSIGWMTFNRRYCTGGDNSGRYCTDSAVCNPGGGTCTLLGTPPTTPFEDIERWTPRPDASYVYTAVTKYCTGGTNPGTVCASDGDCTGGGSCSAVRYPGQVAGWARLLGIQKYGEDLYDPDPTPGWGWVHLRGDTALESFPPPNRYSDLAQDGYHQCSDCSVGNAKCNICNRVQENAGQQQADWKRYACNSCYGCDTSGNCDVCERCDRYGVSYDSRKGRLYGFGWGGAGDESGIGWTQFNSATSGISILQAWLATRFGDIFVGGDITKTGALPSSPEGFNATYVIQANGTIEFTSQAGYLQPNYPSQIPLPTRGNQYINVLGRLDFNTMTQVGSHRYGETVAITNGDLDAFLNALPGQKLAGKIYYYDGDATIDTPVTFQPGSSSESGAGTIIIDGDLTIDAEVLYNTQPQIGSLVNLPSVAWLVRGNVHINPALGNTGTDIDPNLVGAFIVVGYESGDGAPRPAVSCLQGNPPALIPQPAGGVLSTGSSATKYLVVNGLMMTKCFNFERTIQIEKGSEQIIYDGRLIANPPPGLQDLTAVLPVIREVTPE